MEAFFTGFWTWATDHWFLGFCLALFGLTCVTQILTNILKVFHRKAPRLTITMTSQGADPNQTTTTATSNRAAVLMRELVQEAESSVTPRRSTPRRSVYDYIRGNDDD
jgi:hypothetical protein